jgi:hypothetical protein
MTKAACFKAALFIVYIAICVWWWRTGWGCSREKGEREVNLLFAMFDLARGD